MAVKAAGAKAVGTVAADALGAVVVATGVAALGAVATVVAAHGMAVTGVAALGAVVTGVAERGMAAIGVAETGAVVIGVAAIGTTGMAETGAVAIGMAATGTTGTAATGTIGTAGTIGAAMISSSLVAWDFRGGGVGAIRMDIMEATHMVMVTDLATAMEATHMITVMGLATAMATTNMVTATATEMEPTNTADPAMEMGTATGANPELPSYSAGSLALVIITAPSTASWDRRRVKQFAPTSRTAAVKSSSLHCRQRRRERSQKAHRGFIGFDARLITF